MQRNHQSFFHVIQQNEITGNRKVFDLGRQAERQAVALINQYKAETALAAKLACLEQIKKLALLKVKNALFFFKEACGQTVSDVIEINDAFNTAYEEIGRIHENPEFLCEAFYRYSCFYEYNPLEQIPSLQKAFDCLSLAREMKGHHATFASYIYAYLYSGEMGFYNFNSSGLSTLSSLHAECIPTLAIVENDDKLKMKKTKNINYDSLCLEGTIFLANLGCHDAIITLIDWYDEGYEELNIVANEEECNQWQQKLLDLPEFLKEKYREHFEIALQNTKKYGYCDGNGSRAPNYLNYVKPEFAPINMQYFIDVLSQIKTGEISFAIQHYYKQEFVKEADAGNIAACLYLANDELSCDDPEAAKVWYKKILETDSSIYIETPYEIIIAKRSLWAFALEEELPEDEADLLLKSAAESGCFDSALLLGKKCLEKNCNAEAIKYFDLAMKNSYYDIPSQISEILMRCADDELTIYHISILGEGIKRYSTSCFQKLINFASKNCHQEINDYWNGVHTMMENEMYLDMDIIDELIEKTIENYKSCISQQMRKLSL